MKNSILFLFFLVYLSNFLFAQIHADTALIKKHLVAITKTDGYRNYQNIPLLNQTADYIYRHFLNYADSVYFQEFEVNGKIYKNVIASFGAKNKSRIIIGAHYDVCGNQEGADDNASGVVGLLELSRMLKGQNLKYRVDLVAYTLEEPPYFRTEFMGSYIHAKFLADSDAEVLGMVSLEMIGYFDDAKKSQSYPIGILKLLYGGRGDYITLVKKCGAGKFAKIFGKKFKQSKSLKTNKFVAPGKLLGIDFSDHLNYWRFGFSALMLTDTAFYRNKNYHEQSDKMELLDIGKMAKVIDGIFEAILTIP